MGEPASSEPLGGLPWRPANHFRLYFFETLARLRAVWPKAGEELPFLDGYYAELDEGGAPDPETLAGFRMAWERAAPQPLPLVELAARAGLGPHAVAVLFAAGIVEEDHRFASMFDALQGSGRRRATIGLVDDWLPGGDARTVVPRLASLGLVEIADREAPRSGWSLQVPALIWDAIRGAEVASGSEQVRHTPAAALTPLDELILSDDEATEAATLVPVLRRGSVTSVTIRGPASSGGERWPAHLPARSAGAWWSCAHQRPTIPSPGCSRRSPCCSGRFPSSGSTSAPDETFHAPAALGLAWASRDDARRVRLDRGRLHGPGGGREARDPRAGRSARQHWAAGARRGTGREARRRSPPPVG